MRAAVSESYGAPVVVRDIDDPVPGPGELLVRVAASSLNGFDLSVAAGLLEGRMEHRFPVVLGRDFAGEVVGLGVGVERFSQGDQVFGVVAKMQLGDGGFAELTAVPEAIGVVPRPAGLDIASAGASGLAAVAALAGVESIEPEAGKSVLICGATGGVGSFAIQLAASRGMRVIATARPGEAAGFVKDLGASDVVDRDGDVASQVRALAPAGVDAVLHLAGDAAALADLLAADGVLVSALGASPEQFEGRDVRAVALMATPTPESLDELASLLVAGSLRAPITRTYTLDEVPRAIAEFPGSLGKTSIRIG